MTLEKMFPITFGRIGAIIRERGCKRPHRPDTRRKFPVNHDFFDKIDNEQNAYFLGLLYADGSNSVGGGDFRLSLKEDDKHILDTMTSLIQPTKPLYFAERRSENWIAQYMISVTSAHMSAKLTELGCTPQKTYTLHPTPYNFQQKTRCQTV